MSLQVTITNIFPVILMKFNYVKFNSIQNTFNSSE